jgi:hypothetical protein
VRRLGGKRRKQFIVCSSVVARGFIPSASTDDSRPPLADEPDRPAAHETEKNHAKRAQDFHFFGCGVKFSTQTERLQTMTHCPHLRDAQHARAILGDYDFMPLCKLGDAEHWVRGSARCILLWSGAYADDAELYGTCFVKFVYTRQEVRPVFGVCGSVPA